MKKFISYGKNVYNKEEIFAVNYTLKKIGNHQKFKNEKS